ncbi:type I-F CRISPR-associated helicase Cas3f [Amphritea pacifica]|uniref:Type I-F CRISPR-associated helicase Cas3 n=1 Tax=Amphritea pacifica TaxID=2811233 RepID=A0ABS2W7C3_9GAMM|nr:type I-F CRISPR-associated helicase Cas3f [Amphritea pacifica]MBN0987631.1 type I-F CRISPR-associated helicase Cas3 [Amphritea pacifica]
MMVTFVSQCEKKALARTRRVLDAFADRIGDNTWQTIITQEGLLAVKKLLRKTASKSTAVSCHWIRSRSRSDLVWVVGNKNKFNSQGVVPVNVTDSDIDQFQDKVQWQLLPVIKYAASISGLFHDFGKANKLFQKKIDPEDKDTSVFEPYRHEWISLRLFQAFVGDKTDAEWLDELADINPENIAACFRDGLEGGVGKENNPFLNLPAFARVVAWIILSHHRLPLSPSWQDNEKPARFGEMQSWLEIDFDAVWNSYRCKDTEQKERLGDNWYFADKSLPYFSSHWRAKACTTASEARQNLSSWLSDNKKDWLHDHLFVSHLARMSMMLADHHYSSRPRVTHKWRNPNYKVYANSDRFTKQLKQQLDEHLIGVAYNAERIVSKLPKLKESLGKLGDNEFLSEPVSKEYKDAFGWQDAAIEVVRKCAAETREKGFFGINMASTGKGKTLANAKIMYALGENTGGVRFSVALGLRTLTLQTGREFRRELKLNEEQFALLVGGTAVKQLFENSQNQQDKIDLENTGSESGQEYLPDELKVDFSGTISKHALSEWTKEEKHNRTDKMLCAPVLVSTIDHLIPATEGVRGGKQIAPMLRLLTSDLVLDEPDDFGLEDLPALCRLVHWAGMLGSRVLLSTATMPPALAYALFQAYKAGWAQYAKANLADWNGEICCAWFDEFNASSAKVSKFMKKDAKGLAAKALYINQHKSFVADRLAELAKNNIAKRQGEIICPDASSSPSHAIAQLCHNKIVELHHQHHVQREDGKTVSIGLIRMANINPLVSVAQQMLQMDAPQYTQIHYCVYHSRYPLALRSFIENRLDTVLSRKKVDEFWQREEITRPLAQYPDSDHHIFVVLASPVAEVGRDHDYDWAIVEPSSMRSIIQLAGRILRHRELEKLLKAPNVLILNKNTKALKDKQVCYNRPGFESVDLRLSPHGLIDTQQFAQIDASPRIAEPDLNGIEVTEKGKSPYIKYSNLNELEHAALKNQLFTGTKNAKLWWSEQPHWCGEMQKQQRFRESKKDEAYYLYIGDEYKAPYWRWLNENARPAEFGEVSNINIKKVPEFAKGLNSGFWFEMDAKAIYSQLADNFGIELPEVSYRYGEVRIVEYENNDAEYLWHEALGLFQEVNV